MIALYQVQTKDKEDKWSKLSEFSTEAEARRTFKDEITAGGGYGLRMVRGFYHTPSLEGTSVRFIVSDVILFSPGVNK